MNPHPAPANREDRDKHTEQRPEREPVYPAEFSGVQLPDREGRYLPEANRHYAARAQDALDAILIAPTA